ncbi:MAG: major capsid protein [Pseudomonadota bacterium]
MATLDATLFTSAVDVAKREDPSGKTAMIVESLAQNNAVLEDAMWIPTNDKDTHVSTRRVSLMTPTRRRLNAGTPPSKTHTAQVRDRCTSIEGLSQIDQKLERREGPNFKAYRLSEDIAFLESFNQKMAFDMFYATTASDPEDMSGFAQRYASPAGTEYSANVIDAGGSGSDNTSIWLVRWGPQTVHCIYPRNSNAGFVHKDKGEIHVTDADGNLYWASVSQFYWDYGLAVRDPRSVARIGSIDVSALSDVTPTEGAFLFDYMIEALTVTDQGGMGATKPCFYMNQTLFQRYYQQAFHKSNAELTLTEAVTGGGGSERVRYDLRFMGIPIKRVDQISNAEALV